MSSETNRPIVIRSGMGLIGMTTFAFIMMKVLAVGQVAGWSWPWVLSPLWLPAAALLALGVGALALYFVALLASAAVIWLVAKWRERKSKAMLANLTARLAKSPASATYVSASTTHV